MFAVCVTRYAMCLSYDANSTRAVLGDVLVGLRLLVHAHEDGLSEKPT